MAELTSAKTLAGVLADVLALTNSGQAGLSDLSRILKQDPVLSARMLQLASSAAYAGSKSRITTVEDAIRSIGADAAREVALTVGIFDSFPPGRADGLDLLRCWLHAFGVAMVMNRLVPRSDEIPAGTAHLVGLCHDLPELLLRQRFPKEFATAVEFSEKSGISLCELYEPGFGLTRAELFEAVFEKIKLPEAISGPIIEFARDARAGDDGVTSLLVRTLKISNHFAHALMLGHSLDDVVGPIPAGECRTSLIPTAQINFAGIRAEALATTCLLSKLRAAETNALSLPLSPRGDARIGYLRHEYFAALDPLEAALEGLCHVVRLERPAISDGDMPLNGIVVVSPAGDASPAGEICRLREQAGSQIPILHVLPPGNGTFSGPATAYEELHYPVSMKKLARFAAMALGRAPESSDLG